MQIMIKVTFKYASNAKTAFIYRKTNALQESLLTVRNLIRRKYVKNVKRTTL